MKKIVVLLAILTLISPVFAQEQTTYGKLTVYSDVGGADIYVDAKFVGQDRAAISNIPTGKHYVRVSKGQDTIQSGIVTVKEGEETVIVAKPSQEQLMERMRRPNQVLFFGGLTKLSYSETIPGQTINYDHKAQLGFGAEIEFPVPVFDFRIDVGFLQNYPSGIVISATQEANLAVSTPYVNISKELVKASGLRVNGGVGLNYGIYSPGYKTLITIASRMGYQAFLEASLSHGQNQSYVARLGYIIFNGESAYPGTVSSSGLYGQIGAAYQL